MAEPGYTLSRETIMSKRVPFVIKRNCIGEEASQSPAVCRRLEGTKGTLRRVCIGPSRFGDQYCNTVGGHQVYYSTVLHEKRLILLALHELLRKRSC